MAGVRGCCRCGYAFCLFAVFVNVPVPGVRALNTVCNKWGENGSKTGSNYSGRMPGGCNPPGTLEFNATMTRLNVAEAPRKPP